MHAVDLTPARLHTVRENGDRGGGGGLIGDDELDGIEDDLASNEEWEERASYSIRALETPQCNRRKQEGAGTELRVQDGGENANEGDYDCQEGHHGRCGANRRAPRAPSRKFKLNSSLLDQGLPKGGHYSAHTASVPREDARRCGMGCVFV